MNKSKSVIGNQTAAQLDKSFHMLNQRSDAEDFMYKNTDGRKKD